MAKVGCPPKYTKKFRKELLKIFEKYINDNDIPILAEFAYTNNVSRPSLYDWPEFSTLIKRCLDKKETNLEKGVFFDKLNPIMAIFSLKQLGWRDRQEVEHTGETIKVIVSNEFQPRKLEQKPEKALKKPADNIIAIKSKAD